MAAYLGVAAQQEQISTLESKLSALQGELASLEKRNQNITDAMNRWGWSHCTTEKELIEQIDFILGELAERESELLDADYLVGVIDLQIAAKQIDARSPIADARLDYERLPPSLQMIGNDE